MLMRTASSSPSHLKVRFDSQATSKLYDASQFKVVFYLTKFSKFVYKILHRESISFLNRIVRYENHLNFCIRGKTFNC
jgi:hypothetical protein